MTVWHFLIFAILATDLEFRIAEIRKKGFRVSFRESCKRSWFQWWAEKFPPYLRFIGPAIIFLLTVVCMIEISLRR